MDKLERIRDMRDGYEAALDDAARLRDEYHREVVKLHRSGVSLREIAEALGISHQRVHQIVGDAPEPKRSGARRTAGAASIIAVVAISAAAIWAASRASDEPRTMDAVPVDVLATGGSWRFTYPTAGVSILSSEANEGELVLPVGTPVSFTLRSDDVVHAMWSPRLQIKQDMIPGRTNTFSLFVEEVGIFESRDAEFAGTLTLPEFRIRVVQPNEFERWLEA
jgi:cytochrome c oxidase subunit 2